MGVRKNIQEERIVGAFMGLASGNFGESAPSVWKFFNLIIKINTF